MKIRLDVLDRYRLVGDEDCGVGLDCRDCDRGGKPIAYYGGITPAYPGDAEVVQCGSIQGLLIEAHEHRASIHAPSVTPSRVTQSDVG